MAPEVAYEVTIHYHRGCSYGKRKGSTRQKTRVTCLKCLDIMRARAKRLGRV